MMEFAIVLLIKQRCSDENLDTRRRPIHKNKTNVEDMEKSAISKILEKANAHPVYEKTYSFTEKIDFIALFVFAMSYFMFNCVYFVHYRHK